MPPAWRSAPSYFRGEVGSRQVEGANSAVQHNLGLGSACVVTVYEKMDR